MSEGPADGRVAAAVGLLGDWGRLDIVAAILERPVQEIAVIVDRLHGEGTLTFAGCWRVADPATRGDLAAALPAAQRALLRGRIAAELRRRGAADDEVADHLLAAPGRGDTAAVQLLRRVARSALTAGDGDRAAAVLQRALLEPPDEGELAALLVELADAHLVQGAWPAALNVGRRAASHSTEAPTQADAVIRVHRALLRLGRIDEAIDLICGEADARSARHPALSLSLELELAHSGGLSRRALETFVNRFQERDVAVTQPGAEEYLLAGARLLGMGGQLSAEQAVTLVRPTLSRRPMTNDAGSVANTVWLLVRADRHDLAAELLRAFRAARGPGIPLLGALEGLSALHRGMIPRAIELLTNARQDAVAHHDELGERAAAAFLAHALLETGAQDELDAILDFEEGAANSWTAILQVARARHQLAHGHAGDALANLLAVDRAKAELGMTNPAGYHQAEYATEALIAMGDVARAAAIAESNFAHADAWGAPETLARAHRARALCEPPEQAVTSLRRAADLVASTECGLIRTQLSLDLGNMLIRANRRRDADRQLRHAADAAHRLGAPRIAAAAGTALRGLGRRPRRAYFHGVEALTPAELRTAGLVAAGRSNRQVAGALHLSVRTVENQLRSVYQKLDTDRGGLAARLGAGAAGTGERP